jgi:hypothetical protein
MNHALFDVLTLVDKNKKNIPEGDYLTLCNQLKEMYTLKDDPTTYHTVKELYEEIATIRSENCKLRRSINALNVFIGLNILEIWHAIHKLAMYFCDSIPDVHIAFDLFDIKHQLRRQAGQHFNSMSLFNIIQNHIKYRMTECDQEMSFQCIMNVRSDMKFTSPIQKTIKTDSYIRLEMIDANVDILLKYVNVFREYAGIQSLDLKCFHCIRNNFH